MKDGDEAGFERTVATVRSFALYICCEGCGLAVGCWAVGFVAFYIKRYPRGLACSVHMASNIIYICE